MIKTFIEATKSFDLLLYLSWFEIKLKYRRTVLGPLWMVIITAISILCLGVLSTILFKASISELMPYVASGLITWNFMSTLLNNACTAFITYAHIIQNIKINIFKILLRIFLRDMFIFLHSFVVVLIGVILFNKFSFACILLVPISLIIFMVNSLCLGIVLGLLSTRYRDIIQIIQSLLNILIYLTPIMWEPKMLGKYELLANLNPFTHFIALIRNPLLGSFPSGFNFYVVITISTLNLIVANYFYKKYSSRLVFWL